MRLLAESSRVRSNHCSGGGHGGVHGVGNDVAGQRRRCARCAWGCACRAWRRSRPDASQTALRSPSCGTAGAGPLANLWADWAMPESVARIACIHFCGNRSGRRRAGHWSAKPISAAICCSSWRTLLLVAARTAPGSWPGCRWCPCSRACFRRSMRYSRFLQVHESARSSRGWPACRRWRAARAGRWV